MSLSTLLEWDFLPFRLRTADIPGLLAVPIQVANPAAAESPSLTGRPLPLAGGPFAQGGVLDSQHASFE